MKTIKLEDKEFDWLYSQLLWNWAQYKIYPEAEKKENFAVIDGVVKKMKRVFREGKRLERLKERKNGKLSAKH